MFRKNEGYKQLDAFAINTNLSKSQQKLWERSKEHFFFTAVFCKIDESQFSELYSDKKSRPNTPVNQLVGALILKHLFNWTYQDLFKNLNFNLLTRHALGINSLNEDVFCEASIFNFQNKLLDHLSNSGEDLIEKVFCNLTSDQLKELGVNTSVQRSDSFLVGSNIFDYTRLQLLVEVLVRIVRVLEPSDLELLQNELSPYTKCSSSQYIYHIKKEDLPVEYEKLGQLYGHLLSVMGTKYSSSKEYINFKRVFEEHFILDDSEKVKVVLSKELHSGILMSPDDEECTFRDKNKNSSKGYVTHITETVNPANKVNLITDVVIQKNNVGDAEILENRLATMIERTPDLKECFVDGLYGNPQVDKFAEAAGITLYTKTSRGRKSSAGIKIKQDESSNVWISCKGGQKIEAVLTGNKNYKGKFEITLCSLCPFKEDCKIKKSTGKKNLDQRIIYFHPNKILTHRRISNIEKLTGKKIHSRANVEATVKEMKRGMKNGKVRIRGWRRTSLHMIMTAIGINFTRIHKNIGQKLLLTLLNHLQALHSAFMHNLIRYCCYHRIFQGKSQITSF